ncbi:MAG: hypothetical protein K0B14_20045 [Anaerolineaceae bacterium]|nr:hypothetical protein [Anaerolineaceae bacterium]
MTLNYYTANPKPGFQIGDHGNQANIADHGYRGSGQAAQNKAETIVFF